MNGHPKGCKCFDCDRLRDAGMERALTVIRALRSALDVASTEPVLNGPQAVQICAATDAADTFIAEFYK